jgi:branched-chain amino acid transport system substrate-binding protein
MRFDEANYKVAGRSIKLIVEDGATDTSISLQKAKKLVEVDKVKVIIGPIHSGVATGLAPYFLKNEVIDIGLMDHPLEITKYGSVLLYPGTLYSVGVPLGWYAYDKLGYRKITALGADYVAGYKFVGGTTDMFEERGGTVVRKQWAPFGTADFGPYLPNMKKADAVVIWTIAGDLARFLRQYREFGLKMPILIPEAAALRSANMKEIGDFVVGAVGCLDYTWRIDNPSNNKFVAAFKGKFGRKPDRDHANSYIAASIVLDALEATKGDTSYDKLRKAILGLRLETPQGPLSFTPSGIAITNRYICEARMVNGEYAWDPIFIYKDVRDPRE